MIPLGTDTVMLIRRKDVHDPDTGRTQVSYRKFNLKGCSWCHTEQRTRYNETLERSMSITCRVPSDQAKPRPGDYVFLGNLAPDTSSATRERSSSLLSEATPCSAIRCRIGPRRENDPMSTVSVTDVNIDVQGHLNCASSDALWTFTATEWHHLYE